MIYNRHKCRFCTGLVKNEKWLDFGDQLFSMLMQRRRKDFIIKQTKQQIKTLRFIIVRLYILCCSKMGYKIIQIPNSKYTKLAHSRIKQKTKEEERDKLRIPLVRKTAYFPRCAAAACYPSLCLQVQSHLSVQGSFSNKPQIMARQHTKLTEFRLMKNGLDLQINEVIYGLNLHSTLVVYVQFIIACFIKK